MHNSRATFLPPLAWILRTEILPIGVRRLARWGGANGSCAVMRYTIVYIIMGVQGAEPPEASVFSQNSD